MRAKQSGVALSAVLWVVVGACAPPAASDLSEELAVPGDADDDPALSVNPGFRLIVTSYPWLGPDVIGDFPVSTSSARIPQWSDLDADRYFSQASPKYGQRAADLLNSYGVDFLSGFWHEEGAAIFDNFRDSFAGVRLGRLRLVYMAGVTLNFDTPAGREQLRHQINSWRPDTEDSSRYGYAGAARPIIMLWGPVPAGLEHDFRQMIANVRAHYAQVGLNPFIIMSEHGIGNGDEVIRSVDAFYKHGCALPEPGGVWSTATSRGHTAEQLSWLAQQLVGKRNFSTNLPVYFIPGTMPQFDRDLYSMNHEGSAVPTHGRVVAQNKGQVVSMFSMVRDRAPTIYGKRWGVVSTWNEWAEGTTIEPTMALGGKYPGGNYQYDFLEAISEVFDN